MTNRQIKLLLLDMAFYMPLLYVFFFEPELARADTFAEIGLRQYLLVFFPPVLGLVLWFWALYDWGTRRFPRWAKIAWLLALIITLYLGATIYFLTVGWREPQIKDIV